MYFAYRGYSIILIAPLFAIVAACTEFSSMPVYSEIFMIKAAEYFKTYFPDLLIEEENNKDFLDIVYK